MSQLISGSLRKGFGQYKNSSSIQYGKITADDTVFIGVNTDINGNNNVHGRLDVGEDASFNSNVDISGNLKVNGDASFNSNVDISGNLKVDGDASFNSNVDILENLKVDGDASFNSNVDILENLKVDGDASFNSNVDILENLKVDGDASFNSNVDISGNLKVDGDASFNSNVDISENLKVLSRLDVYGDASFNKNVDIIENLNVFKDVFIDGSLTVMGTSTTINTQTVEISDNIILINSSFSGTPPPTLVSGIRVNRGGLPQNPDYYFIFTEDKDLFKIGTSTDESGVNSGLQAVATREDEPFNNNVAVWDASLNMFVTNRGLSLDPSGNVGISGELIVDGNATFNSNLDVSGNVGISGELSVHQDVVFNSNLDVSGSVGISGELAVDQDVIFNSNLDVSGNVGISGELSVHQDVVFNSNLDVSGSVGISGELAVDQDVIFNSNLDVSGNVGISGELTVDNSVIFNSNLDVSGNVGISGELTVDKDVIFNSNLDVSGNVGISGELTVDKDVIFNSNLDVSGNIGISGELTVDQDVIFNSNLDVSGNVGISGELTVDDKVQFNSSLDVSGNVGISGELNMNCNILVDVSNIFFCNSTNYLDKINIIDSSVNILEERVSVIDSSINILDSSVNILEERVSVIDSSINILDSSINILDSSVNILEERVSVIDSSINILDSSVNILEERVSVIDSSINILDSSINILDSSVNILEERVSVIDSSINILDSSVNILEERVSVIDSSINILDSSINILDSSVNILEERVSVIDSSINILDSSVNILEERVSVIDSSINILDSSVNILEERVSVIDSSINILDSSVNILEERVSVIDSSINILDSSVNILEERVSVIDSSINILDSSVNILEERVSVIDSSINILDSSINILDSSVNILEERVSVIDSSINILDSSVNILEERVSVIDSSINILDSSINILDSSVNILEERVSVIDSSINILDSSVNILEERVSVIDSSINILDSSVNILEERVSVIDSSINILDSSVNILEERVSVIDSSINILDSSINILDSSVNILEERVSVIDSSINILDSSVNILEERVSVIDSSINILDSSINILDSSVNILEERVSVIDSSINILDSSINILDSSVNILEERVSVIDSSINILDSSVNILEERVSVIDSSINILDSSINILDSSVNILEERVSVIDSSINILDSSVNILEERVSVIDSSINILDSSINILDSSINILDSSVNILEERVSVIDSSINILDSSVNILEERVSVIDSSINILDSSVNILEERVSVIDSSINILDSSINILEERVSVIDSSINILDSSVNILEERVSVIDSSINILDSSVNILEERVSVIDSSVNNLYDIKYDKTGGLISGNVDISGDLTLNCNDISGVNGITFCDNTYIGVGNSFDISTNQILKINNDVIVLDTNNNVGIGAIPLSQSPYKLDIRNLENNDTRVMINDCSQCDTSSNAMLNLFIRENQTKEHIHFRRAFDTGGGIQIKDFGISVDEEGSLTLGKYDNSGNYEELLYINETHKIEVDGDEGGDFVIKGDGVILPDISLSGVYFELQNKQNIITGAATTITTNDLSINKVVISNSNGKIAVSDLSASQLLFLSDVNSNIQSQINNIDQSKWTQSITGDIYNKNPGNVGIGTTNPTEKLEVSGNVLITNDLSVNGIIYWNQFEPEININLSLADVLDVSNVANQNINMNCNLLNDVSGINFCDGTYIGHGDSFDISANDVLVLSGVQDVCGNYNGASIVAKNRVYQQLNPDASWNAVNGYVGLAKDSYPALNPKSFGEKLVSEWVISPLDTSNNLWQSVCWSPELELFVAVGSNTLDTSNNVMTSRNGINWTYGITPDSKFYRNVVWSPQLNLFVAVSSSDVSGNFQRVITSPDGFNWTLRNTPDTQWWNVCWSAELGLFVAVARFNATLMDGSGNLVMTSPDGENWTPRQTPVNNNWSSVVWSPERSLFVAVSNDASGNDASGVNNNKVMTSSDGINWNLQYTPYNRWNTLAWSPELGMFVALAAGGSPDGTTDTKAMSSPDGINWTIRSTANSPFQLNYGQVIWIAEVGLFVAVAPGTNGSSNKYIGYSSNGVNWSFTNTLPNTNNYGSIAWSPELGMLVAMGASPATNNEKALYIRLKNRLPTSYNVFDSSFNNIDNSGNWTIKAKEMYGDNLLINSNVDISGNLSMNNNLINDVSGINFSDGSYIGSGSSFDISANDVLVLSGIQDVCGNYNGASVVSKNRVYQQLNPDPSWNAVNGYVGLAKDSYPALNPYSSGEKAVSTWTARTTPPSIANPSISNNWASVVWSPELSLFVAVAVSGTLDRVMTSPDGIVWTTQTTNNNNWTDVCWSPELGIFVAVANAGSLDRVMTSPDGITWTTTPTGIFLTNCNNGSGNIITCDDTTGLTVGMSLDISSGLGTIPPSTTIASIIDLTSFTTNNIITDLSNTIINANNNWRCVCWSPELGIFVAVAVSGTKNRVMTSPDGITWTYQFNPVDINYQSICWSPELGLFVAVANNGSNDRVMTSPDGINWTNRTTTDNDFSDVCWSPELGIFVATSFTGSLVMTSPDGIIWTNKPTPSNSWSSICWSPELGLFVAVAVDNFLNSLVMTSPNGINWTRRSSNNNRWRAVCWSPELGIFVAVSVNGSNDRAMTSSLAGRPPTSYNVFDSSFNNIDQSGNWTLKVKEIYNSSQNVLINGNVDISGNLSMNDNLINDVSGINFSDGTYIGSGNSFDISTNQKLNINSAQSILVKSDVEFRDNYHIWTDICGITGSAVLWSSRSSHTLNTLKDGSVILIDGLNFDGSSFNRPNDIWKSDDDGLTWYQISNSGSDSYTVKVTARSRHGTVVSSDNTIILFGGASGVIENGAIQNLNDVWHSYDGGNTWFNVKANNSDISYNINDVSNSHWSPRSRFGYCILPNDKIFIIGGFRDLSGNSERPTDVWVSDDLGVNWTLQFGIQEGDTPPWNDWNSYSVFNINYDIYVLGADPSNNGKLWKSTDEGETWNEVITTSYLPRFTTTQVLVLKNNDIIVLGGFVDSVRSSSIYRSTNEGVSWILERTSDDTPWSNRTLHAATVLNNCDILITGGLEFSTLSGNIFIEYTTVNDVWYGTEKSEINANSKLTVRELNVKQNALFLDSVEITNDLSVNGIIYWNQFEPAINITGGGGGTLIRATPKNATGQIIEFDNLPSTIRRVMILFNDVEIDNSSNVLIQIGGSNIDITNYEATSSFQRAPTDDPTSVTLGTKEFNTGFGIFWGGNSSKRNGNVSLLNISENKWISSHTFGGKFLFNLDPFSPPQEYNGTVYGGGRIEIVDTLEKIRITTDNSGVFTNGTVNILYEIEGIPQEGMVRAIIVDKKVQGIDGGTFNQGSWITRELNTKILDDYNIVDISNNKFILQRGSYLIQWSAPAFNVEKHMSRLRNISDNITVITGSSENSFVAPNNGGCTTRSIGFARVEIDEPKLFEIQHYGNVDVSDNGFGVASDISGEYEKYTFVEIFKEILAGSTGIENDLSIKGELNVNGDVNIKGNLSIVGIDTVKFDIDDDDLNDFDILLDNINKESDLLDVSGNGKWGGFVMNSNNIIYGIPSNASKIIVFDPISKNVEYLDLSGIDPSLNINLDNKWIGGAISPTGILVGAPFSYNKILMVDTNTNDISTVAIPEDILNDATGTNSRWNTVGTTPNNSLFYFCPGNSRRVLTMDYNTFDVSSVLLPSDISGITGLKYNATVLGPNKNIYMFPRDSSNVLIIDTSINDVSYVNIPIIPNENGTSNNLYYGAVLANNKKIYTIPLANRNILEFDPSDNTFNFIQLPLSPLVQFNPVILNWVNGILGRNGNIYGIPFSGNVVLEFNPETKEVNYLKLPSKITVGTKYFGGIMGPDNNIYCVPRNQNNILEIEFVQKFKYKSWMLSSYFNRC
jgi:chromosome segregation ATPase